MESGFQYLSITSPAIKITIRFHGLKWTVYSSFTETLHGSYGVHVVALERRNKCSHQFHVVRTDKNGRLSLPCKSVVTQNQPLYKENSRINGLSNCFVLRLLIEQNQFLSQTECLANTNNLEMTAPYWSLILKVIFLYTVRIC